MSLDSLYLQLNEGIRRAEELEDLGAPGAAVAYLEVADLEARIAAKLPVSDVGGALARSGAVHAALRARDFSRADELIRRYLGEEGLTAELKAELLDLTRQTHERVSTRLPSILGPYSFQELLRLMRTVPHQLAHFPVT